MGRPPDPTSAGVTNPYATNIPFGPLSPSTWTSTIPSPRATKADVDVLRQQLTSVQCELVAIKGILTAIAKALPSDDDSATLDKIRELLS